MYFTNIHVFTIYSVSVNTSTSGFYKINEYSSCFAPTLPVLHAVWGRGGQGCTLMALRCWNDPFYGIRKMTLTWVCLTVRLIKGFCDTSESSRSYLSLFRTTLPSMCWWLQIYKGIVSDESSKCYSVPGVGDKGIESAH